MKWRAAAVVVALLAPAAAPAAAAPSTTAPRKRTPTTSTTVAPQGRQAVIASQIDTLRDQVAEASAEEGEALGRLDASAARRRDIDARLAGIEAEIAGAQTEEAAATARLAAVDGDLRTAEAKLTAASEGLSTARSQLSDRAVDAYIRPPGAFVFRAILERRTFRELAAAHALLRTVLDAQADSVAQYQGLRQDLDEERAGLAAARGEVSAQQAVVAARRAELDEARRRQADVRTEAVAQEAEQRVALSDVRSRIKEFEAQISTLRKESNSISALLRSRQTGQKAPSPSKGVLSAPVPGAITSGFGPRPHPVFGTTRMHNGVDFSGTSGTPVWAAADGVVAAAGDRSGYGATVIVDHGNGLATLYAHQSRLAVAPGATVARGAVVGYVGSTGYSTGPHLHFEVRLKGTPVDPQRYL